jgi:hypothetical protein
MPLTEATIKGAVRRAIKNSKKTKLADERAAVARAARAAAGMNKHTASFAFSD